MGDSGERPLSFVDSWFASGSTLSVLYTNLPGCRRFKATMLTIMSIPSSQLKSV